MRKFKRFTPRRLALRPLLILGGALLLLAAFAPRANAQLIAFYGFENETPTPGYPVNFDSMAPAFFDGSDATHTSTMTTDYIPGDMSRVTPGLTLNLPPPVITSVFAMNLFRSAENTPSVFDMPLFSAQGFFSDMTVSFAINVAGNGFTSVTLFYSTDGGGTFAMGPSSAIPNSGATVIALPVPNGANNQNLLVLRLQFDGGQSNGQNAQDIIDNVLVEGTIVPEPATVAGGLLGVIGLCWFQRRRLRSLLPGLRRV